MRLHEAADGPLARIRIPGGLLTVEAADALAALAESVGDGHVHLTVRGNVELRGIRDAAALTQGLRDAGLLPSDDHERARNIITSPMAGLDGDGNCAATGSADLVRTLDAAICAEPRLAGLSGRFLFGIDDGRGDVVAQRPDLGVRMLTADTARLVVDGEHAEILVAREDVPQALVAAAVAFLESPQVRDGGAWRIRDASSPEWIARLASAAGAIGGQLPPDGPAQPVGPADTSGREGARGDIAAPLDHPVGIVARHLADGGDATATSVTIGVILPLATTDAATWRVVAEHARRGDGFVRTTPWRGVLLGGLREDDATGALRDLGADGLVVESDDPRRRLSACTGLPGCARALADVRSAALVSAGVTPHGHPIDQTGPVDPDLLAGRTVYWAGCERHCGHPGTAHISHTATRDGYVTA